MKRCNVSGELRLDPVAWVVKNKTNKVYTLMHSEQCLNLVIGNLSRQIVLLADQNSISTQ